MADVDKQGLRDALIGATIDLDSGHTQAVDDFLQAVKEAGCVIVTRPFLHAAASGAEDKDGYIKARAKAMLAEWG